MIEPSEGTKEGNERGAGGHGVVELGTHTGTLGSWSRASNRAGGRVGPHSCVAKANGEQMVRRSTGWIMKPAMNLFGFGTGNGLGAVNKH